MREARERESRDTGLPGRAGIRREVFPGPRRADGKHRLFWRRRCGRALFPLAVRRDTLFGPVPVRRLADGAAAPRPFL